MDNKQIIPTALGMSYEEIENLNDVRPYDFETEREKTNVNPIGDFFDRSKHDFNGIVITVNGNIHDNKELLKKG